MFFLTNWILAPETEGKHILVKSISNKKRVATFEDNSQDRKWLGHVIPLKRTENYSVYVVLCKYMSNFLSFNFSSISKLISLSLKNRLDVAVFQGCLQALTQMCNCLWIFWRFSPFLSKALLKLCAKCIYKLSREQSAKRVSTLFPN